MDTLRYRGYELRIMALSGSWRATIISLEATMPQIFQSASGNTRELAIHAAKMKIDFALSSNLRAMYDEVECSEVPTHFRELLNKLSESAEETDRPSQPAQVSELMKRQAEFDVVAAYIPTLSDKRTPPDVEREIQVVSASAFAPVAAATGKSIIVQIFLHKLDQAPAALALAKESDPRAKRRGLAVLAVELAVGEKVGITLDAPSVMIDDPVQSMTWHGTPQACQFFAALPPADAECDFHFCARIWLQSVPIGALRFSVKAAVRPALTQITARGTAARRYSHAFLSYASSDRPQVTKRAQALRAARIGFFQDLLSLEPGERWEARLFEEIDRCDLFLLFWSGNAARSKWVLREARYAFKRRMHSLDFLPDITPIPLTRNAPRPPKFLNDIHFGDPLTHLLSRAANE
jgi:hypothetical protein